MPTMWQTRPRTAAWRTAVQKSTTKMAEDEKYIQDAQVKAAINQKLVETGERERLKELLRTRLVACGWRDDLKAHCKELIKNKGLESITVEDLVLEITPQGKATVPDSVKAELLQRLRGFLAQKT